VTNLTAEGAAQKRILDYINENASEALTEKINSGKKTMAGCFDYIKNEAKKQAVKGCACIEDQEVYGWAIHYFEEDAIKEGEIQQRAAVYKPETTKPEPKKPEPKKKTDDLDGQLDLFSMIGGE
jgi:hypothetical protein